MPKLTKEENQNFKEKLDYLGLDLENLPSFLKEFEGLEYRPSKLVYDNEYVVYRYVPINEIEILIANTNRQTAITEKYNLAKPIANYLNLSNSEESLELFSIFLNMLNKTDIQDIKEVEQKQNEFKKEIPFRIRYEKNYSWQIFYSDISKKYFMLVATEDMKFADFFYLLKKQIEYHKNGNKKEKIYVPISMAMHDGSILKISEIKDIQNYLWLFTADWPVLYELTNAKNEMSIEVVGETNLDEGLKAYYKIHLPNKEESAKFYKLIKALFILQTELSEYYLFKPQITKDGMLEFYFENENVNYDNLSNFIKTQYMKIIEKQNDIEKQKAVLEAKQEELKSVSEQKEREYLNKQKEIATYLQYKRTFLGKVKYFFSRKKKVCEDSKEVLAKPFETDVKTIKYENRTFYTIEDLVDICKKYTNESEEVKNLDLNVRALESKIKSMSKKIEYANIYLNEIDSHKKSIFEFWKFTKKDENLGLNPGEEKDENTHTLKRVFEYESDMEDIGIEADRINRKNLDEDETDSLFIAKTELLDIFNKIKNHIMIVDSELENVLEELKKEAKEKTVLFQSEEYDIFGGIAEDRTQIKLLNGKKHREAVKDKFQILNINKDTTLAEFKDVLKKLADKLETASTKGKAITDIVLYAVKQERPEESGYKWYDILAKDALLSAKKENIIELIKVNLQEQMPAIYDTNILYYDNYNKTLPLGMDLSDKILLDAENFVWELKEEKSFYTNEYFIENEDSNVLPAKKIHIYEYNLKPKEKRKTK